MYRLLAMSLLLLAASQGRAEDVTGHPGRMGGLLQASYEYHVPVQSLNMAQRMVVLLTGEPFGRELLGLMQELRLNNITMSIGCQSQITRVVLTKALKSVEPDSYKGSKLVLHNSAKCSKALYKAADKAGVVYARL